MIDKSNNPGRINLELEDGFKMAENLMFQNPQFRAAAYTSTTSDAAAEVQSKDRRGYNN